MLQSDGSRDDPVNFALGPLFQVPFLIVVPPLRAGLVIAEFSAVAQARSGGLAEEGQPQG